MLYTVRPPLLYRLFYRKALFRKDTYEKKLYLTFDDGPQAGATDWVLDELAKYNAKGTFFCIGKNVRKNPELFKRIKDEGHAVGNHTFNHTNGWQVDLETYLKAVSECADVFETKLFRPPYGKIKPAQFKRVNKDFQIVFWDVIAGDFDLETSKEKCLENVKNYTRNGSVIVFHDSQKASEKMKFTLSATLKHYSEQGYQFLAL